MTLLKTMIDREIARTGQFVAATLCIRPDIEPCDRQ